MPVGETLAAVLDRYLENARAQLLMGETDGRWSRYNGTCTPSPQALFLSEHGTRYSVESISAMVRKTGHQASLEQRSRRIRLRRSFATHLLEGGADLRAISSYWDKVPQSPTIYTQVSRAEVHRVHRETHPRARRMSAAEWVERLSGWSTSTTTVRSK